MKKSILAAIGLLSVGLAGRAQCIDMTTLHSPQALCTYGDTSDPYAFRGVIDFGAASGNSRHTVVTDAPDYNIPTLRTVPEGEQTSVRIGNWDIGAEAESASWTYTVASDRPLLLLQYACVMETSSQAGVQPHMTVEVLDQTGIAIDPLCNTFSLSPDADWHTQGSIRWKEWTKLGINLIDHIGETVTVRLTTYDGADMLHFGYCYAHLSCASHEITATGCSSDALLTAPDGYAYRWYRIAGGMEIELGDGQQISVDNDGTEYYCDCSQPGKPLCTFTLSQNATSTNRYPIADFEVRKVENCTDTLYLTNLSALSSDGRTKDQPLTPCDSSVWTLDDGRQLTTYDISSTPVVFEQSGYHTITLTSYLPYGGCADTKSISVFVHGSTEPYRTMLQAAICEGETYPFGGQLLSEQGTYTEHTVTRFGCDSTTVLRLTVHPAYERFDTLHLCEGDEAWLGGERITGPGSYTAHLTTVHGCDSICHLRVIRHPSYLIEEEATICSNETYAFGGRALRTEGVYYDSAHTQFGCDSITKLTLHVRPAYLIEERIRICEGETFQFRGRTVSEPGVYYDSLLTRQGCDSVYRLVFDILPTYRFEQQAVITEGQTYRWQGQTLTVPGTYYARYETVAGCDSVYKLVLTVDRTYRFEEEAEICGNETYLWHGRTYTASGTYTDAYKASTGADSIYVLNLTVRPTYYRTQYIHLCPNDTFSVRGHRMTAGEQYLDTMLSSQGCDSVVRFIFVQSPDYLFEEHASICPGSSYDFRGRELWREGIYYDSLQSITGCDSVYMLHLTLHPQYAFDTIVDHRCQTEPFVWRGRTISASGVYHDSLTTQAGCDSVYTLHITVSRPWIQTTRDTVCELTPYRFRGRLLTRSGIYADTLQTALGCDSIYRLELTVESVIRDTLTDSICLGDTLRFGSQRLTQAGFYSDTADCRISSMRLYVGPATDIYYCAIPDLCADDSAFSIAFKYRGTQPLTYSLYYSDAAHAQGFADVLDHPYSDAEPITDIIPQYPFDAYVHPDRYMVRIEFDNGFCDPAKYGVDIPFTVRYPSWIMEQNWNDVVALLNDAHNGGYRFSQYEWQVNGRTVEGATGAYLYLHELAEGDEVVLLATREGEDYAIPTCPVSITDRRQEEVSEAPVLVYPTAAPASDARVRMATPEAGLFSVYNLYGERFAHGEAGSEEETEISLPPVPGFYIVSYDTPDGHAAQKVMVY